MKLNASQLCGFPVILAVAIVAAPGTVRAYTNLTNQAYAQVSLVSDTVSNAFRVDADLVNPWGLASGPFGEWVNNNGVGLTKVYGPYGFVSSFAIHVPSPGGGVGAPTGLEVNRTYQFSITNGMRRAPSIFLMATEDGTITAWNPYVNRTNALIVVNRPGAIYKGLAIARLTNGAPRLYAANFHGGAVEVFDGHYNYLTSFTDTSLPVLFAPFNVRNIRGKLFVTFAKQALPDAEDDEPGPGNGYLDVFNPDGTLVRRFASQGALNSPWGMTVAPRSFGKFSRKLLVGNFGDGRINAYDLTTGNSLGYLTRTNGDAVEIEGLWGLDFGGSTPYEFRCDYYASRLYFTAGINDEAGGLFGFIRPVRY